MTSSARSKKDSRTERPSIVPTMLRWPPPEIATSAEASEAARRMVRERCQMAEDDNGQARSVSEPRSGGAKVAKSAAA